MTEKQFWQRVKNALKEHLFLQRIENMVGDGVPDVMYHSRVNGVCGFLELKSRAKLPAHADTPVFPGKRGLRPAQVAWIYCRAAMGAKVWILAQCGGTVWLVHGRYAREFNDMSAERLEQACVYSCRPTFSREDVLWFTSSLT